MGLINILLVTILIIAVYVIIVAIFFSAEIKSTKDKDPAAKGVMQISLLYSGLHALIAYRISRLIWRQDSYDTECSIAFGWWPVKGIQLC